MNTYLAHSVRCWLFVTSSYNSNEQFIGLTTANWTHRFNKEHWRVYVCVCLRVHAALLSIISYFRFHQTAAGLTPLHSSASKTQLTVVIVRLVVSKLRYLSDVRPSRPLLFDFNHTQRFLTLFKIACFRLINANIFSSLKLLRLWSHAMIKTNSQRTNDKRQDQVIANWLEWSNLYE